MFCRTRLAVIALLIWTSCAGADSASCDDVSEALEQASSLSGIPLPGGPLPSCQVLTRPALTAALNGQAKNDEDPCERVFDRIIYATLGIIRADFDHELCLHHGEEAQISAHYDEQTKTIYLLKEVETHKDVLVHELVHFLQDRASNLSLYRKRFMSCTDAELAALSLVEGQAIYVEQQVRDSSEAAPPSVRDRDGVKECRSSEALQALLYMPYTYGLRLMHSLAERKIDAASLFHFPPQRTSEVLRPQWYLQRLEKAVPLNCPVTQGVFGNRYQDSLGQYFWFQALKATGSTAGAVKATRGLISDAALVKWSDQNLNLTFSLVFNSSDQASLFASAFSDLLKMQCSADLRPDVRWLFQSSACGSVSFEPSGEKVEINWEDPPAARNAFVMPDLGRCSRLMRIRGRSGPVDPDSAS